MKNAILAGGAGGVFLIGIAVGVALRGEPTTPAQPSAGWQAVANKQAAPAATEQRPELIAGAKDAPKKADADEAEAERTNAPARAPSPYRGPNAQVPPPPPPPSAAALAEGERVKRELDKRKGKRGGGRVTTLIYPTDKAEAKKLEAKRLGRWERRLQYGMNIKIKGLRTKVGLSPNQEARLQKILQDELTERKRLVSLHMQKQLSNTTFDEKVKENRDTAKAKVKALLTARQFKVYQGLKPREQVLRDDVK